jgi:hypothetical protein
MGHLAKGIGGVTYSKITKLLVLEFVVVEPALSKPMY